MRRLQRQQERRKRRQEQGTAIYDGFRNGQHWARLSTGQTVAGTLETNGAIAIGDPCRYANGRIDGKPYRAPVPEPEPPPSQRSYIVALSVADATNFPTAYQAGGQARTPVDRTIP